jgi:hypothetical protein
MGMIQETKNGYRQVSIILKHTSNNSMKYIFFFSLILLGCNVLPDVKGIKLFSTQMTNKKAYIRVMYYPSNATLQSSIQVQKIVNDSIEVIKDYERYNYMDTWRLINDTTLMLVIRDTTSNLGNKSDTMRVVIK